MTLAKSLINPKRTLEILFDEEEEKPILTRFNVMVMKKGYPETVMYGFVVTHLTIADWALMKGWDFLDVYPGTRPAFPDEKTDLA